MLPGAERTKHGPPPFDQTNVRSEFPACNNDITLCPIFVDPSCQTMLDRLRWNERYGGIRDPRVNENLMRFAAQLKPGRVLDLAGGLGQNSAWLAASSDHFYIVDAD